MAVKCQLAQRNQIRAFRAGSSVLIVAEGELPTPGFNVDIVQSLILIFPPQFSVVQCPKPGVFPQVITPYRYAESVPFPPDQDTITVHHADGSDAVKIEECPAELAGYSQSIKGEGSRSCPPGADEATGFSKKLSFDEAFANAVANLPPIEPPVADALSRVQVVEIGGLFGGIAGFNDLFVRICRTHDG
ncbi:MAG: hypothetical protein ACRDTG_20565 [Pseudonocardiaceae bacterium]